MSVYFGVVSAIVSLHIFCKYETILPSPAFFPFFASTLLKYIKLKLILAGKRLGVILGSDDSHQSPLQNKAMGYTAAKKLYCYLWRYNILLLTLH